jgi:hypothetical protein
MRRLTVMRLYVGSHSVAVVGYEANGSALRTTESITVH